MISIQHFAWERFFGRLYNKVLETDIFGSAAQTAFYFSFSIFPLIYFLVSLFGLALESADALKSEVFAYLLRVMPLSAFELVRRTVDEVVANSSGGKLTLGLVITLWSASSGVDATRRALNAVYELKETRAWWRTKLESLGITLVVTFLAALTLAIVFYGTHLIDVLAVSLGIPNTSPLILISIQWLSILLLMLFACEIIFNLLPDFKRFQWRWITPGSVVAIVLWLMLTSLFRLYIASFNSYDRTYGSLGAVIILMFWLYLTALVVMVGGAINSVISDMREETGEAAEASSN